MALSSYAAARADLAAAITAAVSSSWIVHDHPADAIADQTIMLSARTSIKQGPGLFHRELVAGIFVRRDSIEQGFDQLDGVVPTVAGVDIDGLTVGDVTEPRELTIADSSYLAVFVPFVLEVTLT